MDTILLNDYIARHNAGVASGDFDPMLELFSPDAELRFDGIPFGPCVGRHEIAEAFRLHPPDDELIVNERSSPGETPYAWRMAPEKVAGTILLEPKDGAIQRLVITVYHEYLTPAFGRPSPLAERVRR